jgi:glutaredoxin-related protein
MAKEILKNRIDIQFDYRNISESTKILKEFLSYRDNDAMFQPIKEAGRIGIPFFLLEDGSKTFEISDIIQTNELKNITASTCSIDGKGNC